MTDLVQKQDPLPPVPDSENIVYATTDEEQKAKPAGVQVRIPGLDICRGFGMITVLVAHALMVFGPQAELFSDRVTWAIAVVGHFFVEQFFGISGFLMGGILLREVVPNPSAKAVGGYVAKRWLRTLPVYFVIIGVLMLIEHWRTGTMTPRWEYIFFVQNFIAGGEYFLAASWSLAIEQWSYLLLPVVMLPVAFWIMRRFGYSYLVAAALAALAVIVISVTLRTGIAWLFLATEQLDFGIRKQIPLRLDVLMYGLLIVLCKHARPDIYKRMASLPFFLMVVTLMVGFMWLQFYDRILERFPGGIERFVFHSGIGFAIVDSLMALTLPFLDINPASREMARVPRVRDLLLFSAKYSYAVYLVHLPFMFAFRNMLLPYRVSLPAWLDLVVLGILVVVSLLISFGFAWLLYHVVEKPGMSLRRFIPK